jgi:hypothetical protein
MFCDLAMMFDQLAHEFRRFENERDRAPVRNQTTNHRGRDAHSTWLARMASALKSNGSPARPAAAKDRGCNVVPR